MFQEVPFQAEDAGIREMRERPRRQCFDEALRSAENQLELQGAPVGTQGVGFEELSPDGVCIYFAPYYMQRLGAGRTESVHCFPQRTGTPRLGQAREWRYK